MEDSVWAPTPNKDISDHDSPDSSPDEDQVDTPTPVDTTSQARVHSPVRDLLQAHGFPLDSIFKDVGDYASDMRPSPIDKILRVALSVSGESISSRTFGLVLETEGSEHDCEEDLGRDERCKMYLSGLRNLVPELKHAEVDQTQASGHFSLLQVKYKGDKMPFLGKVFYQVAQSSIMKQGKRLDLVKKIGQLYPTEPAESGLLQT